MEYDNSGVRRQDRLLSEENALHAAFRMPSYHDFIHAEFIDRDSSYFIEESKGLVITPPAFLMLLTSPLRIPGAPARARQDVYPCTSQWQSSCQDIGSQESLIFIFCHKLSIVP